MTLWGRYWKRTHVKRTTWRRQVCQSPLDPVGFLPVDSSSAAPWDHSSLSFLQSPSFSCSFVFLAIQKTFHFTPPSPFSHFPAPSVSVSFSPILLLSSAFSRIHSIWLVFSSRELICNLLFFQAVFCFQETKCLLCVMFSCVWLMITGQLWAVHL